MLNTLIQCVTLLRWASDGTEREYIRFAPGNIIPRTEICLFFGYSMCTLVIVSPVTCTDVLQVSNSDGTLHAYQNSSLCSSSYFQKEDLFSLPPLPDYYFEESFAHTSQLHGMLLRYLELAIKARYNNTTCPVTGYITPSYLGGVLVDEAAKKEFGITFNYAFPFPSWKKSNCMTMSKEIPRCLTDTMSCMMPLSAIKVRSQCSQCKSLHAHNLAIVPRCCGDAYLCIECAASLMKGVFGFRMTDTYTDAQIAFFVDAIECPNCTLMQELHGTYDGNDGDGNGDEQYNGYNGYCEFYGGSYDGE